MTIEQRACLYSPKKHLHIFKVTCTTVGVGGLSKKIQTKTPNFVARSFFLSKLKANRHVRMYIVAALHGVLVCVIVEILCCSITRCSRSWQC